MTQNAQDFQIKDLMKSLKRFEAILE
jgi:hypothetical protein